MMKTTMLTSIVTLSGLAGVLIAVPSAKVDQEPSTLYLNLTTGMEDVHAVHMGLAFAEMGQKAGRKVVVFFNVNAPQIAVRTLGSDIGKEYGGTPLSTQLNRLKEGGAVFFVCPHCSHRQGIKESDLLAGAKLSTPEALFENLPPGTVSVTY